MTTVSASQLAATGTRLRVDAWTAGVINAMRERGIRAVLLKGPALRRWLYAEDPDLRTYSDADLIVSPAETKAARALLDELGFVALWPLPLDEDTLHAVPYQRESDGANVDLHRTLHGLQDVSKERVWQAVSTDTDVIRVGNVDVEVPRIAVRLLHLVLNIGHHDDPDTQPWRDLERGLKLCTLKDWQAAAAIARELNAETEVAVRLRRLPEGAELADRLGLTRHGSPYYRLRGAVETGRAPTSVHSIWVLAALPNTRSRLAHARNLLLPGKARLRERSELARRGHTGLAGALHVADILYRLPATLIAWARHYRE